MVSSPSPTICTAALQGVVESKLIAQVSRGPRMADIRPAKGREEDGAVQELSAIPRWRDGGGACNVCAPW